MKLTSLFKILSLLFTLLIVLVAVPIGFLLFTDPNDYKSQLEELAAEQDIALKLNGDLEWQVYPEIRLMAQRVVAGRTETTMTMQAELHSASLMINLRPLLSGQLSVRGIEVEGMDLQLTERGDDIEAANTESSDTGASDESNENSGSVPQTRIDKLTITDLNLNHTDRQGVQTSATVNRLFAQDLDLSGSEFPLELNLELSSEGNRILARIEAMVSADVTDQRFRLDTDQLSVEVVSPDQSLSLTSDLSASADLSAGQWTLGTTQTHFSDLSIKTNASGGLEPFTARGQIELNGGAELIQQLSGAEGLGEFKFSSGFTLDDSSLALDAASGQFQGSKFAIALKYFLDGKQTSSASINLDRLDLSPFQSDDEQSVEEENSDSGNPLASLDDAPAMAVQLTIGEILADELQISDVRTRLVTSSGQAVLTLENAGLADGTVKGLVKAFSPSHQRNSGAANQVEIPEFTASHIDLGQLARSESGGPLASGIGNFDFRGGIKSLESSPLATINGSGNLRAENLALLNINIEQRLCESAQLLGGSAAPQQNWAADTQLQGFNSPYTIEAGILQFDGLGSALGNVQMSGNGEVNLDSLSYSARFSVKVNGDRTSDQGCSINRYLRNARLPLACSGELGEGGESSCGLDSSVVSQLLKGAVASEVTRQLGRLLGGDQNGNDQNEQPKDSKEELKDGLRGLLDGLLDRDN